MESGHLIFDRSRVSLHKRRAAAVFARHDFLLADICERIAERLDELGRAFPAALSIGAHGMLEKTLKGRGGIERLTDIDLSDVSEELLPCAPESSDLVLAASGLHWINDLPGMLIQIRQALKPGGLFIAVLPGGETLKELRQSFEQAEMIMKGGVSPRVSPFVDVRDGASLLARAGFAEPVADSDTLTASYAHPLKLLHELRGMGETNALIHSANGFTPCSLMMAMCDHYLRHFSDEQGRIPASFELVTLTGWKP